MSDEILKKDVPYEEVIAAIIENNETVGYKVVGYHKRKPEAIPFSLRTYARFWGPNAEKRANAYRDQLAAMGHNVDKEFVISQAGGRPT